MQLVVQELRPMIEWSQGSAAWTPSFLFVSDVFVFELLCLLPVLLAKCPHVLQPGPLHLSHPPRPPPKVGHQLHRAVSDTNSKWLHGSQLLYARTSVRSPRKPNHCLSLNPINSIIGLLGSVV